MVCLVVNGKRLPKAERLIEKLIQIEGMTSITISPNTRRDNVIMGDSYEILWGQGYITDYIGNVKYQISPLSFYQVKMTASLAGCGSGKLSNDYVTVNKYKGLEVTEVAKNEVSDDSVEQEIQIGRAHV